MADSPTSVKGRSDSSPPGVLEATPTPNASLQVRRWQLPWIGTKLNPAG
ncbi:hypothetical protein [Candidatus Oscillochloris fontis]|nr:hypothetical protein [Candidatus Oscillochloris fontis]